MKRIRKFSSAIFTIQVASLRILLIQSQVVYFGSRIKHSCLRIYGVLVCKEFSRSFHSCNSWQLHASRNCRKFVYCSLAIHLNHAAEHIFRVAILYPFQESYLLCFGERIISFERAETNHNLHKLSSFFFLRKL